MKHLLFFYSFFIIGTICFAQNNKWVKSGDYLTYKTIGYFENSATKNSKLGVVVIDEGEGRGIRIYLHEYSFNNPEARFSHESGNSTINVFLNDEWKEFAVYYTPSSMYFREGSDFYNLLKTGANEKFTVIVRSWRFYKHNNAQYTFELKSQ